MKCNYNHHVRSKYEAGLFHMGKSPKRARRYIESGDTTHPLRASVSPRNAIDHYHHRYHQDFIIRQSFPMEDHQDLQGYTIHRDPR